MMRGRPGLVLVRKMGTGGAEGKTFSNVSNRYYIYYIYYIILVIVRAHGLKTH